MSFCSSLQPPEGTPGTIPATRNVDVTDGSVSQPVQRTQQGCPGLVGAALLPVGGEWDTGALGLGIRK